MVRAGHDRTQWIIQVWVARACNTLRPMSLWVSIAWWLESIESSGHGRWLNYWGMHDFVGAPPQPYCQLREELQRMTWYTISIRLPLLELYQVFQWSVSPQEICMSSACTEGGPKVFIPTQHSSSFIPSCDRLKSKGEPCAQPIRGLSGGPQSVTKPWWPEDIYPSHYPYMRPQRGLIKSLRASWYLNKSTNTLTRVCISIVFTLPYLYCCLWLCSLSF